MNRYSRARLRPVGGYQRGAATLAVAVLLLFILSVMSLYAARLGITEQRLTHNELRHRQALAAAQAGLERTLGSLASVQPGDLPRAGAPGPAGRLPDGSTYQSLLLPRAGDLLTVRATGNAPDGGSAVHLSQSARFISLLRRLPPAALIARAGASLHGGRIQTDEAVTRIWSGGAIIVDGAAVTGPCSDRLCPADSALAGLPETAWPAQFFTLPPALLGNLPNVRHLDGEPPLDLTGRTLGSPGQPVLVFVTGPVAGLRNSRIHGLLHVNGDVLADAEGLVIEGALISDGRVTLTGGFQIRYRPAKLTPLLSLGRYVPVPGSRRDEDLSR